MEKLDLSKKNKKPTPISLEEVDSFLSEMCEPVPAKRPKNKKEKKDSKNRRLAKSLDLTKEDKVIPALAPMDFVPDVVLVESEAPADYEAPHIEVEKKTITYNSSIVPDNFDPEVGFIEEEKEFVYEIPEGFEPPKVIKKEIKEEPEELTEELTEEVIAKPKTAMEILADQVAAMAPSPKEQQQISKEAILENKVLSLEKALYDTRRLVLEMSHGTMVSGLGATTGGGEVWLKYLDDVSVNNIQDGDSLVWDATLQQFIPSSADVSSVNIRVLRMEEKFISFDDRIQKLLNRDVKFVELEENTTESGESITPEPITFIDETLGGDTTTFVVTQDAQRNVYELDGIPQPTVQLPRGDTVIFDISGLDDPASFDVFQNGVILETGRTRDDTPGSESITINTALIPQAYTKLYYRHVTTNGLGWIINITEN